MTKHNVRSAHGRPDVRIYDNGKSKNGNTPHAGVELRKNRRFPSGPFDIFERIIPSTCTGACVSIADAIFRRIYSEGISGG